MMWYHNVRGHCIDNKKPYFYLKFDFGFPVCKHSSFPTSYRDVSPKRIHWSLIYTVFSALRTEEVEARTSFCSFRSANDQTLHALFWNSCKLKKIPKQLWRD